jgi:beta-glucosidase/6-phospho-beta-glucosidase/beta-galactosidase
MYAEPSDDYLKNMECGHHGSIWEDEGVKTSSDDAWPKTDMGWNAVPWGFRKLLVWIHRRYAPKGGIIVTENGCAVADDERSLAANDTFRVNFYGSYLMEMHKAMTEYDVDVRGYYAWSFIDNYEWAFGYSKRFGLHWVNYQTMERMPKASAAWYARLIQSNTLHVENHTYLDAKAVVMASSDLAAMSTASVAAQSF